MVSQHTPHSTIVRSHRASRHIRPPQAIAVLLAVSLASPPVAAQRTVSWQVGGGPVNTVFDQSAADGNPVVGVISTPIGFTAGGLTITGTVNGSFIAGLGGYYVQITNCTITTALGSPAVASTLVMSYTFGDAPLSAVVYGGAHLNGKYGNISAPASAGTVHFANIDIECHLNNDANASAVARGRQYSGPGGPIPFWDMDIRRTNYLTVDSVTGIVPFSLGGNGDRIILPNSAEAGAGAQDGYDTGFEGFYCSPSGWPLAGQDGFSVPAVAGSIDSNCYTYWGNILGVPQNPNGGSSFVAGRSLGGTSFARSQRAIPAPSGRGLRVDFDVCCTYLGSVAPTNNIGSLSFQPATARAANLLARWPTGTVFPPTV